LADPPDGERRLRACPWCGNPLTEEEAQSGVCRHCARILMGAGLCDEEINGEKGEANGEG
jgi:hypothetical protein